MIRFCDKEAGYAEYDLLDRSELLSYFFSGHMDEIVCVFDDSELCRYRGKITYYSLIGCQNVYDAIQDEYNWKILTIFRFILPLFIHRSREGDFSSQNR